MRIGRPEKTTHREVERVALDLFTSRGFEATTVGDIAEALGVRRRTVFRYFASKNDIVWGDFDWVIRRLRNLLADAPTDEPLVTALARAVVSSNVYDPADLDGLRTRMQLITTVPALQAHSMLRYEAWRRVVAEFAADRLQLRPDDLPPQAIAHVALGTSLAAFGSWVSDPESDLIDLLDRAYAWLVTGYP